MKKRLLSCTVIAALVISLLVPSGILKIDVFADENIVTNDMPVTNSEDENDQDDAMLVTEDVEKQDVQKTKIKKSSKLKAETKSVLSGHCGAEGQEQSVQWKLEENNQDSANPTYTLIISGQGTMKNWKYISGGIRDVVIDSPWSGYSKKITKVTVADGVILGERAFQGLSALESIDIPDNITEIPKYAFADCVNLANIVIPDGVTSIGEAAFRACDKVTEITIPSSVTEYGTYIFRGCQSLTKVNLPENLTILPIGTFQECTKITSVQFPEAMTTIGDRAFNGCINLKEVVLPSSITTIGQHIYNGSGLEKIDLSKTDITVIPVRAFESCVNLKEIIFPKNVDSINMNAFLNCSGLENITLPEGLDNINSTIFNGCTALKTVDMSKTSIENIHRDLFKGCEVLTDVKFPAGLKTIGGKAFQDCPQFIDVTLPESLESFASSAFHANVERIDLSKTSLKSLVEYQFKDYAKLKKVLLPETLETISYGSFINTGIEFINIPESVNWISGGAFGIAENPSKLKSVTMPTESFKEYEGAEDYWSRIGAGIFKYIADDSIVYLVGDDIPKAFSKNYIGNRIDMTKTSVAVLNGGSYPQDSESYGNLVEPVKEGYLFGGWYDNKECTGSVAEKAEPGKIYYAKWTAGPRTVTDAEEFEKALNDPEITKIIVDGEIDIPKTFNINRSIIIEGKDDNAKLTFEGLEYQATQFKITYTEGMKVELKNLKIDSDRYDGVVKWTNDNTYVEGGKTNPAVLRVEDCKFVSSRADKFSPVGIGMFQSGKYNGAASVVEVDNCSFDGLNYGMYFNDETPQLGLSSKISNSTFANCYAGIYGIVANTDVDNNEFLESCKVGIELILNKDAKQLNTTITNNLINSDKAINMGPYHLNDNNALKGTEAETVVVDKDRLPTIKKNQRDADEYLANLNLYRDGSSEYLTLAEGALDLSENYTAGKQPQVSYTAQNIGEGKNVVDKVENIELLKKELENSIINDEFYVDANMNQLVNMEDVKAAEKVDELINAIGSSDTITLDSKDAIMAAKAAYEALTEEQKALVTGLDDLNAAIDAYKKLLEDEDGSKDPSDKPGDEEITKPVAPNGDIDGDKDSDSHKDKDQHTNQDKEDKEDKDDSDSVKTGDDTTVGLLAGMLLLSGAGFVALRRKEK